MADSVYHQLEDVMTSLTASQLKMNLIAEQLPSRLPSTQNPQLQSPQPLIRRLFTQNPPVLRRCLRMLMLGEMSVMIALISNLYHW